MWRRRVWGWEHQAPLLASYRAAWSSPIGKKMSITGNRRFLRQIAPWLLLGWLVSWSMLVLQPCCDAFAMDFTASGVAGSRTVEASNPPYCAKEGSADLCARVVNSDLAIVAPDAHSVPTHGAKAVYLAADVSRTLPFNTISPAIRPIRDYFPSRPFPVYLSTSRFRA